MSPTLMPRPARSSRPRSVSFHPLVPFTRAFYTCLVGESRQDFATSTNANHRKGGLIGLAATSIGLMSDIRLYLDALLPPVLHCFDDPESRVRYYSCESLYNIAKVARGHILKYFNQIFDGLCKLFADVDVDVKVSVANSAWPSLASYVTATHVQLPPLSRTAPTCWTDSSRTLSPSRKAST